MRLLQGLPMIIVAAIGLGVNFTGMRLLSNGRHSQGRSQVENGHLDNGKEHAEESLIVTMCVFDLHIWTITSGINAVSGHVW